MTYKTILSICLFITFSGCLSDEDKGENMAQTNDKTRTILALGDSLTEGYGLEKNQSYPSQLEKELHAQGFTNWKVINAGISGETSGGTLERVDWTLSVKPDIVILVIGANDAMRGYDLDNLQNNINQLLIKLKNADTKILLGGMQIYNNLGASYAQKFKGVYLALASSHGVEFMPFFLDGVAGENSLNISDRIHPNAKGYAKIIKKSVLPKLLPMLERF